MNDRRGSDGAEAPRAEAAVDIDQPWSTEGQPVSVAPAETPTPVLASAPEPAPTRRARPSSKPLWSPFESDGQTYVFDHLVEFDFTCRDSDGVERAIQVVFTDHVFTRDPESDDQRADAFPGCSRTPFGMFCPDRHRMSHRLPELIESMAANRVWALTGEDRYAQIPVVDDEGRRLLYAVIFSLDRLKGDHRHLRMLVRSAHFCDRKPPDTFGEVKFAHLVKLRLGGKHPRKIFDRGRKRPKMP